MQEETKRKNLFFIYSFSIRKVFFLYFLYFERCTFEWGGSQSGCDGKSVWLGDWLHIDCWVWYFEWLGGETGGDLLGYLGQELKGRWGDFGSVGFFKIFLRVSLIFGVDFLNFIISATFWKHFSPSSGQIQFKNAWSKTFAQ